jgi:hypothetical protein
MYRQFVPFGGILLAHSRWQVEAAQNVRQELAKFASF